MNADELHHVLFWREREELDAFSKALAEKYSLPADGEAYSADYRAWMKAKIPTAEAFYARVADYAAHAGPDQIEIRQSGEDLGDALRYATKERGEDLCARWAEMARGWAFHLEDYGNEVHAPGGQMILEIATGAGMGTWAVMSKLPESSRMVSMDFDYVAAQNANGIALALGLTGRAAGIRANNWYMPFDGGLFDTVCTHYGLDECREIPAVLSEVARVLRPGGRFVLITRMDPAVRQGKFLELFGAPEEDCREVLRQVRLNSGPEDLIADAAQCGLQLAKKKEYRPEQGHDRVLLVFEKRNA